MNEEHINGDCHKVACDLIISHIYRDWKLVQGLVNGYGPVKGTRFAHSWIENSKFVIDQSNGNNAVVPKEIYYRVGHVNEKELKRYSRDKAVSFLLKLEHYGPWEITGEIIQL